ncbi:MAG TPA: alpha/beta hydrolase [Frateuria sp.]|uniref:alpha/beta hydrolase n=1 Tax=Frateuria sp. TaxID=2211372 RepID=UPI002DED5B3B|nr:alpha/beta hydrolase [Frateuria sp.]
MERWIRRITGALALVACATVQAQSALPVWPGAVPGPPHAAYPERTVVDTPLGTVVFDVTTPTLTTYLPDPAHATGTGVIVAPGGACLALTMDLEGTSVARWLQRQGIAAFVLKYRIQRKQQQGIPADLDLRQACREGMADGIQAVRRVRQNAAAWGVSPHRIGFLGFSAGAMIASGALLQADAAARPDFAALIYGAPFGTLPSIPRTLPPVFMAWAQDDDQARAAASRFYDALLAAGQRPEAHIYANGGHGFGLRRQGASSDHWIDAFAGWMQAQGFMRRAAPSPPPDR